MKNLINELKIWRKNKIIQQHPLFKAAQSMIHELLDGRTSFRSFFTDATITTMVQEVLDDVVEVIESESPILTSRKKISEAVFMMAMYQVLIIESKDIEGTLESELHKIEGVSCELRKHIKEIYENVDYIKEAIDGTFITTNDVDGILSACDFLYGIFFFRTHVFLVLLFTLKDTQDDWFKPFFRAMCINHENVIRCNINLPYVGGVGDIQAAGYYSYLDMVQNEQYPNLVFKEYFPDLAEILSK